VSRHLLVLTLSACSYSANFVDCEVRCTSEGACPAGLACGDEGLCRVAGETTACAQVLRTPPSCVGLPATCGPGGDESCCSSSVIPGGTFFRSYDVASDGMFPDTSHPATVGPFVLDRFEVTVGRFRAFVNAGMGTQQSPPMAGAGARHLNGADGQGGWDSTWDAELAADAAELAAAVKCDAMHQSWTDEPAANEELPVNCITWFEAFAFCAWDGGFLSTEAEWNFAASGGDEQRAYPWSAETSIDCTRANYSTSYPSSVCAGGVKAVGAESTSGDGRWSQADLGGNVLEWMLDSYAAPYADPCDDCARLTIGDRVVRGGDWANAAETLRSAWRSFTYVDNRDTKLGARCARLIP
jgi:sulfatase modifying factor 1